MAVFFKKILSMGTPFCRIDVKFIFGTLLVDNRIIWGKNKNCTMYKKCENIFFIQFTFCMSRDLIFLIKLFYYFLQPMFLIERL